jgi:hypothetical protein
MLCVQPYYNTTYCAVKGKVVMWRYFLCGSIKVVEFRSSTPRKQYKCKIRVGSYPFVTLPIHARYSSSPDSMVKEMTSGTS